MPPARDTAATRRTPLREQPLTVLLAAAVSGIAIDRLAEPGLAVWWSLAAMSLAVWLGLFTNRRPRAASVALVLSLAALFGSWRHVQWNEFAADDISRYASQASEPVALEVIARSRPERIPAPQSDPLRPFEVFDQSRLVVDVVQIRDRDKWLAVSGQATVTVEGHLLGVYAGDRLRLVSQLTHVRPLANPGGFDFAAYARADRRLCRVRVETPDAVEILARRSRWHPVRLVDDLRTGARRLLAQHVPAEHEQVALALLLGVQEGVDEELDDAFLETGTIHLLAISGLHVTIVAGALWLALRTGWLPRRTALIGIVAVVVFYTVLTEARPPVLRATLFITLMAVAAYIGRPVQAMNVLALAAIVCLVVNPSDLFRAGPQFSFLGTAALVASVGWIGRQREDDPLEQLIERTAPLAERWRRAMLRGLADSLLVGAVVWVVTMPLALAWFHIAAPVSVLLNPLVGLPIAVAIVTGFAAITLGWLVPPLGALLGYMMAGSLAVVERLVIGGSRIPLGHAWLPGPATWWLAMLYALLAVWIVWRPRWLAPREAAMVLGLWLAVGLVAYVYRPAEPALRVTTLSVGHGLATVIELPDGRVLLYDAGDLYSPDYGADAVCGCLWSRGRSKIDELFLSHSDLDHYNSVPRLVERLHVGGLRVAPPFQQDKSASVRMVYDAAHAARVPLRPAFAGVRHTYGDVTVDVLHPPPEGVIGNDNANSLVLAVHYAGRIALLTGDIERDGLERLLAMPAIDCDVLVVPHHGSRFGRPNDVARWCTPEYAVISDGTQSLERPEALGIYQTADARVFHTARDGAVTFTLSHDGVEVVSQLPSGATRQKR